MKSVLINPMGTTPMVSTEMFEYLHNVDKTLNDIVLLYTDNTSVTNGSLIAREALKFKYPQCRVTMESLDMDDIMDKNSLIEFLSKLISIINTEKQKYNVDRVYVNVSGGRKIQSIAISIYAGLLGIDSIYNVFDPSMQNVNERYEQIKYGLFEELKDNIDPREVFYGKKDEILDLFFPDLGPMVFFNIDILKFPEDERNMLKEALYGVDFTDGHIEDFRLKAYQKSGLITFDKSRTYPTDLGEVIRKGL